MLCGVFEQWTEGSEGIDQMVNAKIKVGTACGCSVITADEGRSYSHEVLEAR